MHFHSQNLTDGRLPMWREGRAWWGPWHAEWHVFRRPRFAVGIEKGGYDNNRIQFHLSLFLFTLYVSRSFQRCFEDRELSIDWHHGSLWLKLWCDDEYHSKRPWHRNTVCLHVVQWFTGDPKFKIEKGEPVPFVVPMPEGCYPAEATPETLTWTYRFGFKRVRDSWSLNIPKGIPFEGKGENSWDCGADALHGTGGDTLEKAIGNAVASVLEYRRRYGETEETRGRIVMAR
jgi:hypothetical protein